MLNIKVGKCEKCGYDKCIAALEFHHIDPSQKDFQISKIKRFSIYDIGDEVRNELTKCQLLCCNCHRETHFLEKEKTRVTIRISTKKTKATKICPDCQCKIYYKSHYCKSCYQKYQMPKYKAKWPPVKELTDMVKNSNYTQVGKILGVSGNAVKKRLKEQTRSCV